MAPLSSIHAGSIVMNPESQETSPKLTESIQTHTSLKIVYQIAELTITREDILRGYIDVSPGAHIEIQNNNLSGYMVIFKGLGSPVREIVIKGLGKDTLIDSDGGWIVQPYHGRDPLFVELSYRFKLSGDAQPGTYAWPLKIAVSPIIPV
jgi:hypothetical protein